jgi:hypothetical protein
MKPLLVFLCICQFLLAATGTINVFSDDQAAEIFIDNTFIAKQQVIKYPLEAGEHRLQVKKNNKVYKSEIVTIEADKTKTIVADNFVEFKTDVPNRGSLDVEGERVRESRGNIGIGLTAGSPSSGLSLRYWPWRNIGFQLIGLATDTDTYKVSGSGLRLLFAFRDSIFNSSTFTPYAAIGTGRTLYRSADAEGNILSTTTELSLGVEMLLMDPYKTAPIQVSVGENDDLASGLLKTLFIPLGSAFLQNAHLSLEAGIENQFEQIYAHEEKPTTKRKVQLKFAGGFHFYF